MSHAEQVAFARGFIEGADLRMHECVTGLVAGHYFGDDQTQTELDVDSAAAVVIESIDTNVSEFEMAETITYFYDYNDSITRRFPIRYAADIVLHILREDPDSIIRFKSDLYRMSVSDSIQ